MSLYYSINGLLVLAILVLPYMPDSPKVVIAASAAVAAAGTIFSNMLLYFPFYRNLGSEYVTR